MISINLSELVWTIINFFLLLLLLKRFLYTPILRFMAERQARIDAGLEAQRAARESIREQEQALAAQKADSREQAKRLAQSAAEAAGERREQSLREAREAAGQTRIRETQRLEAQRAEETERLRQAGPELAELLARRLLGEEQA